MLLNEQDSQLILIDYQDRLMPSLHEGPSCIQNALRLAKTASAMHIPIWGVEQNPEKLGPNHAELKSYCSKTLNKMSFSAVADGLLDWLVPPQRPKSGNARSLPKHLQKNDDAPQMQRPSLVLAGCEAHVCLMQTALELLDNEMEVWVVTDACSSRTERNRDAAFDRLAGSGAELLTTEMVLFEWLKNADHPSFKLVQSLIK